VPVGAVELVTVIGPDVAVTGTVALSRVDETSVCALAATPLNLTTELALKPTPLIVTTVPWGPLNGLTDVIENVTVKGVMLAHPDGVLTVIVPVAAPLGTVTLSWVPDFEVMVMGLAPSVTFADGWRPLPLIVTLDPVRPEIGVIDVIVGETKKSHALTMLPFGVVVLVTVIGPVVALVGTIACITVAESCVTVVAGTPWNLTVDVSLKP
jgi:hypothetical protein